MMVESIFSKLIFSLCCFLEAEKYIERDGLELLGLMLEFSAKIDVRAMKFVIYNVVYN